MAGIAELKALSVSERLQLVEDLWDSIAEDQAALHDPDSVVEEIRARKARYLANPTSAVSWETAKHRIRSGRA